MRQTPWVRRAALIAVGTAAALAAVPAPATATPDVTTQRIAGPNRYATAAQIADVAFGRQGTGNAILASGTGWADALSGGFIAGSLGAPILLTDPNNLSPETKDELVKLNATTVDILGGTDAVSANVEQQLPPGTHVVRHAGPNRYATGADIIGSVSGSIASLNGEKTAIVVSGASYADAVSASGLSYKGFPTFLTDPQTLSPETQDAMNRWRIQQVLIMGGPGAVSPAVEDAIHAQGITTLRRFAGADRFDTATQLAAFEDSTTEIGFSPAETVLYRSDDFADSLTAGGYAGGQTNRMNQLPVGPGGPACGSPNPATAAFLQRNSATIAKITAIGGTYGVCDSELSEAASDARGG